MQIQTLFPDGKYGMDMLSYVVPSGAYYITVATLSGTTWTLTADGAALAATNETSLLSTYSTPGIGIAGDMAVLDSSGDFAMPFAGHLRTQPAGRYVLHEDFDGVWVAADAQNAALWLSTKGSGANSAIATAVSHGLNGEITLLTSTAAITNHAANATLISGANKPFKASNGAVAMEVRMKLSAVTNAAIFVGFTDEISSTVEMPLFLTGANIDSDATDACGVGYDARGTTKQFFHGGVKAGTDTTPAYSGGLPVIDTYFVVRVEVSAAGAVQGFVNGTAVGAAVANAVTTSTPLTPCIAVLSATVGAITATIDYIRLEQERTA